MRLAVEMHHRHLLQAHPRGQPQCSDGGSKLFSWVLQSIGMLFLPAEPQRNSRGSCCRDFRPKLGVDFFKTLMKTHRKAAPRLWASQPRLPAPASTTMSVSDSDTGATENAEPACPGPMHWNRSCTRRWQTSRPKSVIFGGIFVLERLHWPSRNKLCMHWPARRFGSCGLGHARKPVFRFGEISQPRVTEGISSKASTASVGGPPGGSQFRGHCIGRGLGNVGREVKSLKLFQPRPTHW